MSVGLGPGKPTWSHHSVDPPPAGKGNRVGYNVHTGLQTSLD